MAQPKQDESTAIVVRTLDVQALIKTGLENNADVEKLERLFALAKDVRAQQAREAWFRAMAEFQETCPPIKKSKAGVHGSHYAPLDEIMSVISPVMGPLGLSVAYRVKHDGTKVTAECVISHEMGHSESSGPVTIPVGEGAAITPGQHVGVAQTYAKRYALLAIVGLAPEEDADASTGSRPSTVQTPARASAHPQSNAAPAAPQTYRGRIVKVETKTGTSTRTDKDGKKKETPWTLYLVKTHDGVDFGTFDTKVAEFANQAGTSEVVITWEPTAKGSKNILTIDPAEREPGEEDPLGI